MKKLLIVIGTVVVIALVVIAALALAMTNRYTGTFTFQCERTSYGMMLPPSADPEVSFEQTSFWDYILQGKGIGDPYFIAGYVAIWVNITDSSGEIHGGSTVVNWSAMDEPDMVTLNLTVEVRGLTPGEAVATITVRANSIAVGSGFIVDKYDVNIMYLEVG